MTIATLTGHAVLSVGNYSAIMDNGPAREEQVKGKAKGKERRKGEAKGKED